MYICYIYNICIICIFKKINLFMVALGLQCCMLVFSSCSEWGATLCCGPQAFDCDDFSCFRAVLKGTWLSCPAACGIFLNQRSSPYSLHWWADSSPLDHQESPAYVLYRDSHFNSCHLLWLSVYMYVDIHILYMHIYICVCIHTLIIRNICRYTNVYIYICIICV